MADNSPAVQRTKALVRRIAAEEGLPPDLIESLVQQESSFNPNAVSPKGAAGLMQLMPATAGDLGLSPNERFDPEKNVRAGVRYFKQQLSSFGGDYSLALAAYNAGPGAVRKAKGIPKFEETQKYVAKLAPTAGGAAPSSLPYRRNAVADLQAVVSAGDRAAQAYKPATGGITFSSVAPLPSLDAVNAGSTAELDRLRALTDRVNAFTSSTPPAERGLGPLGAIAYGALGAIAPERQAQLAPEMARYRNLDIEQYNRERGVEAQNIGVEADLAQAQTGAEGRQRVQLQEQEQVMEIMNSANHIIEGGAQAAKLLSESEDPLEREAGKEVMRRVLMFRELVSHAQEADPGALGAQFVEAAHGEVQGIQAVLDQQRGFDQKKELVRMTQEAAANRSAASTGIRMELAQQAMKNKMFAKYAREYGELRGLVPVLDEAMRLASSGVGGVIAGYLPKKDVYRLDAIYADFKSQLVFGEAGKAFTATERMEIVGKIPYVTDTLSKQVAAIRQIQAIFARRMVIIQRIAPGVEAAFGEEGEVPLAGLEPNEMFTGDFDLRLLGYDTEDE